MKVASTSSADDVKLRLCFFVKVLKARGLKVAGGNMMGSVDGVEGSCGFLGRIGWAGVPKAGDDDGMISAPRGFEGADGSARTCADAPAAIIFELTCSTFLSLY